jgi:hypothetical protein
MLDRESAIVASGNHAKLQEASLRKNFVPEVDVPWPDGPLEPLPAMLPLSALSLSGLEILDRLTESEQAELARHEASAFLSAFIRFEGLLAEYLSRETRLATSKRPRSPYLFHIVEEEARHSRMFARAIDAIGAGWYTREGTLGVAEAAAMWLVVRWRPLFFQAMLAVECVTDGLLAVVHDGTKNEVIRAVARIHRIEEARHLDFAGTQLALEASATSAAGRHFLRLFGPIVGLLVYEILTPPSVYLRAGVAETRAMSWRLWWQRRLATGSRNRRWACMSRFHRLLVEAGIGEGLARPLWSRISQA